MKFIIFLAIRENNNFTFLRVNKNRLYSIQSSCKQRCYRYIVCIHSLNAYIALKGNLGSRTIAMGKVQAEDTQFYTGTIIIKIFSQCGAERARRCAPSTRTLRAMALAECARSINRLYPIKRLRTSTFHSFCPLHRNARFGLRSLSCTVHAVRFSHLVSLFFFFLNKQYDIANPCKTIRIYLVCVARHAVQIISREYFRKINSRRRKEKQKRKNVHYSNRAQV